MRLTSRLTRIIPLGATTWAWLICAQGEGIGDSLKVLAYLVVFICPIGSISVYSSGWNLGVSARLSMRTAGQKGVASCSMKQGERIAPTGRLRFCSLPYLWAVAFQIATEAATRGCHAMWKKACKKIYIFLTSKSSVPGNSWTLVR